MRWLAILLPALSAALALWGGIAEVPALFWAGAAVGVAALVRRMRAAQNAQAALLPGVAILCGGNFVHPWYFGLAAGLCVWAGLETVRAAIKR